jgi:PAS domain S-box-containing protein
MTDKTTGRPIEAATPPQRSGGETRTSEDGREQQQLRRLAMVVRDSNDAITIQDFEGNITAWNHGAELMYGYSEAKALQMNIGSLTHPGKVEEQKEFTRRLMTGEAITSFETQRVTKDGRILDVWMTVTKLVDDAGRPSGIASTERDVTDRNLIASSLRETKDHLENLIASANAPIIVWDSRGKITRFNRVFEEFTGRKAAEVLGQGLDVLFADDQRGRAMSIVARASAGERLNLLEVPIMHASGVQRTVLWNSAPIFGADGKTQLATIAQGQDITERKQAEEKMKRLATVVRDSNDAITIHNFEGNITAWNHGAELMYGYSEATALLMNIGSLTHPGKVEEQKEFTRRLMTGEAITSFETQRVTKDGHILDVWMTVTKLVDDTGRPIGIASTERDITGRKRTEEQLRQAQKMEAVGRLAGGVAHDFNNLLTAILGYAELSLQNLDAADPVAKDLVEIKKCVERAAALTHQLLAFSRKLVLIPRTVDLNAVLNNMHKMLKRLVGEDIQLHCMTDSTIGSIKADSGKIEQVVMNLVVNARDAMPKGGDITLDTADVDLGPEDVRKLIDITPGPYVLLSVKDTGTGMDEETQRRLFEPFFTTKGEGRGTGLGLATIYGIVKQSDGYIHVESKLGKGTMFSLYFPRVSAQAPQAVAPAAPLMTLQGTETILLAEDEDTVRNLTSRILKRRGYTVLEAANGGEALLACEQHPEPIDLLLTDMIMPKMNGRDLAKRLISIRPDMRVIFMSGYTDPDILKEVMDSGLPFLLKPFKLEELARKVREVLQSKKGGLARPGASRTTGPAPAEGPQESDHEPDTDH